MKFQKKPVVIEAFQFRRDLPMSEMPGWFTANLTSNVDGVDLTDGSITIRTLEGNMKCSDGDWIIKGVQGELYPCKPDIFAATYEPVVESEVDRLNAMTDHELAS